MRVKYFGEISDFTNCESEDIQAEIGTSNELEHYLDTRYNLKKNQYRIAVNLELIAESSDHQLNISDEIAVLSPFAGG